MSEANTTPDAPAAKAGANVIRIVQGAEETAQERLIKKQIPAWVISGAFHVVFLVLFIVVGKMQPPKVAASDAIAEAVVDKEDTEGKNLDLTNVDKGLDSELASALPVDRVEDMTVAAPVNLDVPVGNDAKIESTDASQALAGFGAGSDIGVTGDTGDVKVGDGGAGGTGMTGMAGRSGATKEKSLLAGGGNDKSELAVARALLWLDRKQIKAQGNWVYDGTSRGDTISATAMSLLPFLAAGQTHLKMPKDKNGKDTNKYQATVALGLKYLLAHQLPNGSFKGASGQYMYSHAIAAVALCEAYGMTGDKNTLLGPARKAIEYIVKAQAGNGSWGYTAGTAGDTSIVGWQIQALKSAALCKDITVPEAAFKKASEFLDKVAEGSLKSRYGYTSNSPTTPALSAVGLLCRYYTGWGPRHPGMIDGVKKYMNTWMPTETRFDMYYYYYATQVTHFHEGEAWHKDWNPKMRDLLIKMQVAESNKDLGGSWDPDSGMIGSHCGRLGTTCLALLTLEVYYRHLPLYKRDATGLKELERVK
ncbi:prenyltransferase/squalene oxidase repeat-containing protein [Limnoglobus roseus]|uniref:Squalene cyclase C-terminal domain-containing protein n=1 Tax=Limnoglobus roseus TaxID=2598579 RepID=A0A5C1ADU8_9BACT|nr:prenyltransferase/squalene oxidase repeat-containing protein [Limnoglobus roseus]QEL16880.1 hypothetical protein PX52LOC_03855 [Limnoglobus roseus]